MADKNKEEAIRQNFLACLILTAQNGFGRDVDPFVALCRETWGEEVLWDAVKDLPHGKLELKNADGAPLMVDEARADGTTVRVRAVDPFGKKRTRLMYAAQAGDVARLRWLLERGAQRGLQAANGRSPLMMAAQKGRLGAVKELLKSPLRYSRVPTQVKNSLEQRNNLGRTALWHASKGGETSVVEALLARGAAVDARDNEGATPLYIASSEGHLDVVAALIKGGAAVDAAQKHGATPLHIASREGHLDVLRELLRAEANVNAALNDGTTPLFIASHEGHLEVVQELLAAEANVNAVLNDGTTPLFIASENKHLGVVRELLARGAAVDAARNDGGTPIMAAVGNIDMVNLLLEAGATVTSSVQRFLDHAFKKGKNSKGGGRRTYRNKKRRS